MKKALHDRAGRQVYLIILRSLQRNATITDNCRANFCWTVRVFAKFCPNMCIYIQGHGICAFYEHMSFNHSHCRQTWCSPPSQCGIQTNWRGSMNKTAHASCSNDMWTPSDLAAVLMKYNQHSGQQQPSTFSPGKHAPKSCTEQAPAQAPACTPPKARIPPRQHAVPAQGGGGSHEAVTTCCTPSSLNTYVNFR